MGRAILVVGPLHLLDEGIVYAHPERTETATVWAESTEAIAEVLTYHYGNEWSDVRILPKQLYEA